MRLLHTTDLVFREFFDYELPKYAILSHRWSAGSEATIKDLQKSRNTGSSGYKKVQEFASYVQENVPGVDWIWIDTCCINQESAAELSEAVNLMFEWYRNAEICIAYLADIEATDDEFTRSEWFERGWTLQELLAPRFVFFVTKSWQSIGCKGDSSLLSETSWTRH